MNTFSDTSSVSTGAHVVSNEFCVTRHHAAPLLGPDGFTLAIRKRAWLFPSSQRMNRGTGKRSTWEIAGAAHPP